jgi:hypothetical protein
MTKRVGSWLETAVLERFVALVSEGIVFASGPGTAQSSLAFPSICVLPSGRWLASCRAAPQKIPTRGQHVLLSHSDDEGRTWSTPSAPFEPPAIDGKPGLFRSAYLTALGGDEVLAALIWVDHCDPDADFFNEETEGLLDTRIFLSRSHDGGENWSTPHLVDAAPFDVPTPLTGPVLLGRDSTWICQFETNKPYNDLSEWRHSSVLMISRDEGASWPEYSLASLVGDDRIFYWDQRPGVAPDGGILNLFWTYDNANSRYLNIHAREWKVGRWSEYWDTGVSGQPAPPVFLRDGRIAMVYVDRSAGPVLKLRLSEDGGHTWPESSEAVLYELETSSQSWNKSSMQDAWAEMGCYSFGLPATALLPEGDVLVVFYAGPHNDRTDVRWVRVSFTVF